MKRLTFRNFLIIVAILSLSIVVTGAVYGKANSSSDISFIQPRKAKKAQKKQDAREKQKKKAVKNSSKEAQKRSYEIQSPDVQARMKQNKKDAAARDKAKKKSSRSRTKKGSKKYR